MLDVNIVSPTEVIFKGEAESIIMPGEYGVFEVLAYHKPVLSRLIQGIIDVDGKSFPILRGVVKAENDKVTAIVEK